MKIILLSDVKKVGKKGQMLEVSDGYARNYLIKNRLAVAATEKSIEILEEQKAEHAANEAALEAKANELKTKLETIVLEFKLKAGAGGRVFGTISSKQICEELLKKHDIKIDKRKLIMDDAVSGLGTTFVKVDLYRNKVIGKINVHVSEL